MSDTIGVAHPGQVRCLLTSLASMTSTDAIALHFHDTRGTALANVLAALEFDIATFDASAGGLGGCPYAPGATGNLATEDLIYMLDGLGIETGIDLAALVEASRGSRRGRSPAAVAVLPRGRAKSTPVLKGTQDGRRPSAASVSAARARASG